MPSTAVRLKAYGDWLVSNKNKQGSPEFEKVAAEYRALRSQPMQGVETPAQPEQPAPKERPGFWGSLMESAETLGLADEAAEFAANPTDENRRKFLAAGESKFQSVGGFGKGENWEALKELVGGSIGAMVAPVAAGSVASVFTTPLGGLAAGYGTATTQETTQGLLLQAREQERALAEGRTPKEISALKAVAAGAASAGLDYIGFSRLRAVVEATPFLKNLITPSEELAEEAAKNLVQAARDGTLKSTARGTVEGVVKGTAFEVPQEVAQTALQRWQAGLSLSDQEARDEYTQAAIGAAILGPVMGGAAGAIGARAEREKGEALVSAEDKAAADLAEANKPPPLVEQPPKVPAETAPIKSRQEPLSLGVKEIRDEILKMESVQNTRAEMMSDLDTLRENVENSGGDFDSVLERIRQNFDSTATRIDIFAKRLDELSKAPDATATTSVAPIPQTAAAQQTLQIDSTLAKGLNLPGADTAPKGQPFVVSSGPVAPIPQIAGAQQTLGLPQTGVQETPANVGTAPVAPIPQNAAAQQALPIPATETVEDPIYRQAVAAVVQTGDPTVSTIQSVLKVGYRQASELLTRMELEGVVSRPDPKTMQRKVMMGQAPEVSSAAEQVSPRVAEQVKPEPVGGGDVLPPSGSPAAGPAVTGVEAAGVEPAARVAGDVATGEAAVKPALEEKTSDQLFKEIEDLKSQALSLLVGKFGKRPAGGTKKRKEYDALQERIAELTGQWGRQVSKEQAARVASDVATGEAAVEPALTAEPSAEAAALPPIPEISEDATDAEIQAYYEAVQARDAAMGIKPTPVARKKKKKSKLQDLPELKGVDLNDLGNAVGKAVKGLPALTDNVRDAIRRILDLNTLGDNARRGVYAFLSLHQQAQLFIKELPGLKDFLRVIQSRAGALKARREVLDRNVRRWSRILRENNAQMEEFFDVANESSRLQIQFKSAAFANHSLTKRFNALPKDLKKIYWEMLKSYSDMADEYLNLVTKNVSESAAKEFRAAMAEKRLKVYLPLYREGDYWLRYQDAKNETVVRAFETYAARAAAQKEAEKQGAKGFQSFGRIEEVYKPGDVGPFFDKVVKELEEQGISKEVGNALYNLYLDQIPTTSVRQQFRKREGFKGAEQNLIKVYSTIASRMANQLTNLEYVPEIDKAHAQVIEQMNAEIAQSDSLAVKALKENLDAQMDYIRNPVNSSMVNGLASFSYFWFIIGNVSTAAINLMQVPGVVYPYLAGEFPNKAGDALTEAKNIYLAGGWDNDIEGEKRTISDWTFGVGLKKGTPLARLYEIAVQQSAIRRSSGYDAIQGQQKDYSESDYVGKKVFAEQLLGWTFQNSERFNREVTLIAAFNLQLEKNGGDVNAAAQYAIDVVEDTHGSVLNETAPRAFQSNLGKVAFVFKSFAQTQIFLQYRLLQKILKGKDLETRKVAAKQFAGIMGMAFLFAGVQGLPLYGAASVLAGLIEEAFGDEDNPMDPDEYLRQAIGSLAYKGPISQLLQSDIASRTGFNNMLWREDEKRVEEIGPFLFAAEQIFGASYAALMNIYRAGADWWDDEVSTYRALETSAPAVIKNGMKAWRFAKEGALTRKGDAIVEDFSAVNIALQGLGFSPLEFAEKSTAAGKIASQQSKMQKRKEVIFNKIYLARKNGNKEDVAEARAALEKYNSSPFVIASGEQIDAADINQSVAAREARAKQSVYGIRVKPKSAAAYEQFKPEGYGEGT